MHQLLSCHSPGTYHKHELDRSSLRCCCRKEMYNQHSSSVSHLGARQQSFAVPHIVQSSHRSRLKVLAQAISSKQHGPDLAQDVIRQKSDYDEDKVPLHRYVDTVNARQASTHSISPSITLTRMFYRLSPTVLARKCGGMLT